MTEREALKLALKALEEAWYHVGTFHPTEKAIDLYEDARAAIKEALAQPEHDKERCVGCEACIDTACGRDECPKGWPKAAQPEQEPVAWMYPDALCDKACLYLCTKGFTQFPECANTPPQRTWVGLTDEDKKEYVAQDFGGNRLDAMDWAEKRLKEKNT